MIQPNRMENAGTFLSGELLRVCMILIADVVSREKHCKMSPTIF